MKKIFSAASLIIVLLAIVFLFKRRAIGDYSDPGGPQYQGSYAEEVGDFDGSLRTVTWNVHYAQNVEQVIETLEGVPELRDADILLFQEINSEDVETVAKELEYNYVFYPANFNRQRRKEYGNAILAKWPLNNPAKIVLPNFIPHWLESRNSARATVSIGGREIIIYSTHLDTYWMVLRRGVSQAEFLRRGIGESDGFVIIGGDFNTWLPASIASLDSHMESIGLVRISEGAGYTFEWRGVKLTLDHIYSESVEEIHAGVYRQTDASDHYPVWAEMTLIGGE